MLKNFVNTKILKRESIINPNDSTNVKVYLRLRPLNEMEKSLGGTICVENTER
jgi:hypothetical protein